MRSAWKWAILGAVVILGSVTTTLMLDRKSGADADVPVAASLSQDRSRAYHPERLLDPFPPLTQFPVAPAEMTTGQVDDQESIVGVIENDEARAYPVQMIKDIDHEILNDTVGGQPIVVTWCNRCQSGQVYSRRVGERLLTFFVPGILWQDNMVLKDVETSSEWSQVLGEAMSGPLKGSQLDVIPSVVTTWKAWLDKHPRSSLLTMDRTEASAPSNGFRYPTHMGDKFMLAIARGKSARGWTLDRLRSHPVINDNVADTPVLVTFDPASTTCCLFSRQLGDRTLTFRECDGDTKDDETGSRWDRITGWAMDGPLRDAQLARLPAVVIWREKWLRFYPRTTLWAEPDERHGTGDRLQ